MPKWPWDAKDTIALTLTVTVCFILVMTGVSMLIRAPAVVPEDSRQKFSEVVVFLIGAITGHLTSRAANKNEDDANG